MRSGAHSQEQNPGWPNPGLYSETAVVSPYNFSLLPFRPPRLSGFAGALFALLCREFLSRGLSAPLPELDSCLILFDHAIFALDLCAAVRITLLSGR